jgi:hypothetical protein
VAGKQRARRINEQPVHVDGLEFSSRPRAVVLTQGLRDEPPASVPAAQISHHEHPRRRQCLAQQTIHRVDQGGYRRAVNHRETTRATGCAEPLRAYTKVTLACCCCAVCESSSANSVESTNSGACCQPLCSHPSASARADSAPRRFRCGSLLPATDSAQKYTIVYFLRQGCRRALVRWRRRA